MTRIYLFDIDGTLMRGAGPLHGEALVEAIRHTTGLASSMDGIPVHGMLDGDILTEMMMRAGHTRESAAACLSGTMLKAQEIYPGRCPDLRARVLPGVREVLQELTDSGVPVGLVTGNLTSIGWTKVDRAGLRRHFQFGAFADMGATRAELAQLAFEMAGGSDPKLVTLIGDAPADVIAARANGFRIVSVATGMTSREELEALKPDLLLNDLSEPSSRRRLIEE